MASLVSLPIDCIIRILQSCDKLSQAIALSSTCKHLHSVYSSSSSANITHDVELPLFGHIVIPILVGVKTSLYGKFVPALVALPLSYRFPLRVRVLLCLVYSKLGLYSKSFAVLVIYRI
jgi:hypothetical protein